MHTLQFEIAATAAALVVEEGLEYGPAKRRAVKQMGLPVRTELPDNELLEDASFGWAVFKAHFHHQCGGGGGNFRLKGMHVDCESAKTSEQ